MLYTAVDSHGHHNPAKSTTFILSSEEALPAGVIMSLHLEAGAELPQEVIWSSAHEADEL